MDWALAFRRLDLPASADNGQRPIRTGLETPKAGQMTGNGEPPAERRQATTATETSPERTLQEQRMTTCKVGSADEI